MKRLMLAAAVVLGCGHAHAAIKACGELKSEIAAKLDVVGVKSYELMIADKGEAVGGKVVGSCENSSKKITYTKYAQKKADASPSAGNPETEQEKKQQGQAVPADEPPAAAAHASSAIKDCGELKAEIAAKIMAKGVKSYELTIADKGEAVGGKVVGSCENSSKKITYAKK